MTHQEDKDLSACMTTNKAVIPLTVANKLAAPLKCDAVANDFKIFKKSVAKTIKNNLDLLKELPPPKNFSLEELRVFLKKGIKTELEKDPLFEQTVEVGKYASSMLFSMEKYFKNIFRVDKENKERNCQDIFNISKGFLNSNLPDSFLEIISMSYYIENDFTDLFDKRIRKEHLGLIATKNNETKFERLCEEHNQWVIEFTNKVNSIGRNRTKLVWYVDINNSKTLEELFKDKIIKIEEIDEGVLNKLIEALKKDIFELELLLTKNSDLPCILQIGNDDSIKAISEMMEILHR